MPRGEEGGTLDFKWLNGGKNQNPQKFLDQNLTPQKFFAQFPSHKNFQKALKWYNMKNRNVWSVCVCLFIRSRDTRELSRIFRLLWIPPKKSLPKSSYLPKFVKILTKIFLFKKFPEIKNFKPKKILWSSLSLEIQRTPTGRLSSQYWKPFALVWKPYWIYM